MRVIFVRGASGAFLCLAIAGCGGDDESLPPAALPDYVDLIADTNRDGLLDLSDNDGEAEWSVVKGAAFLANLDDDDQDGVRDGEDTRVNVDGDNVWDAYDLTPIALAQWPGIPAGAVGKITIDAASAAHVRMFKKLLDGSFAIVGGAGACDGQTACNPAVITLTADEIKVGAELFIEGLRLTGMPDAVSVDGASGQPVPWSGNVELRYQIVGGDGNPLATDGNPQGLDVLQLRVAPWLMFGNHMAMDTVYANSASFAFINGVTAAVNSAAGITFQQINNWPTDHWTEDYFQTGFTSVPWADGQVHGMRLSNPRPWGRGSGPSALPITFLEQNLTYPDAGSFVVYRQPDPNGSTYDSHGNHDLVPGYSHNGQDFPYGRIVYGSGVLPETKAFYEAQLVQAPALTVDTSWLTVGHVDEVFSYVPAATERGWKLLVASPQLGRQMLLDWQQQGHGAVELFVGKQWWDGSPAATSIDAVLADTQLMAWSQQAQTNIDGMLDVMVQEIGLAEDEIVEIPFLFENDFGLVAYNPGTVNIRVLGDTIVAPDPFGPRIGGADGFEKDLEDRLGAPAEGLGSDGQGLDVFFADDWDWYHVALGEVHCGTNFSGPPQPDVKWWEAMQ